MRYTQIFEHISLEISVPFDFHSGISEVWVEWFAFRKFNNLPPFQNISEILVEWKAPNVVCVRLCVPD